MNTTALWVVTKSPVGLDDAAAIIGSFTSAGAARGALHGAGTYLIARVVPNRVYREGELLDVECVVVPSAIELRR